MASDAIAGTPSGSTTLEKIVHSLAPSSRAASSRSAGIPAKKLRRRNMANGRPKATWNSTTPGIRPYSPNRPYKSATGISATCSGTTSNPTTKRKARSRPLNRIQAKA